MAAFLRVINAQEHIRSALGKAKIAKQAGGAGQEERALSILRAEIGHATRVLEAGKLHAGRRHASEDRTCAAGYYEHGARLVQHELH